MKKLPEFTFTKLDDEYKALRDSEVSTDIAIELFKSPNSTKFTEGRDTGVVHDMGSNSRNGESLTTKLMQTYDWSDKPVAYHYNSFGLRGPEPNEHADRKILFMGSSFTVGTGINEEDNHTSVLANMLNADYVNLAPCNNLAELIEPAVWFIENYKPDLIVLSETRGIHEGEFFVKSIHRSTKMISDDLHYGFRRSYKLARQQFVYMFFKTLHLMGVPVVFLFGNRNKGPWQDLKPFVYDNVDFCYMDSSVFKDLARDNHHPGPETHKNIAELLHNHIIQKGYF